LQAAQAAAETAKAALNDKTVEIKALEARVKKVWLGGLAFDVVFVY
jgi:hypothetical protein